MKEKKNGESMHAMDMPKYQAIGNIHIVKI